MPDTGSIRILIAEDDDNARTLLVELLNSMGHVVVAEVTGGREAIERAKDVVPDVVLLDVHMPDGSGIEAAEQIAAQVPGVAVVLFSGDQTITLSEREIAATAAIAFLPKPTPPRVLDSTLRLAVSRAREFSLAKKDAAAARGALENRKTIERAKGILMRRTGSSEQEAYRILQRTQPGPVGADGRDRARGARERAWAPGERQGERQGEVRIALRAVLAVLALVLGALGCTRTQAPPIAAPVSPSAITRRSLPSSSPATPRPRAVRARGSRGGAFRSRTTSTPRRSTS